MTQKIEKGQRFKLGRMIPNLVDTEAVLTISDVTEEPTTLVKGDLHVCGVFVGSYEGRQRGKEIEWTQI